MGSKEINTKNKSKDITLSNNDKKVVISVVVGGLLLVIALALLVPSSPLNIWNIINGNRNAEIESNINNLKDMYSQEGINLEDSDIEIETIVDDNGSEQINVFVSNEDKRQQQRNKTQSALDKIIADATGTTPPKRDDQGNIIDPDNDIVFPSIEEVIETVNINNNRIKEFINNSYSQDGNYEQPLTQLLMGQRQTGNPSSSSDFPISIYTDGSATPYSYFQNVLNGETFYYVNFPDDLSMKERNYFYPYFSMSSDSLYNNILGNRAYNKNFDLNSEVAIGSTDRKDYVLYLNTDNTITYTSIVEVNTVGSTIILGMENNQIIMLDII